MLHDRVLDAGNTPQSVLSARNILRSAVKQVMHQRVCAFVIVSRAQRVGGYARTLFTA